MTIERPQTPEGADPHYANGTSVATRSRFLSSVVALAAAEPLAAFASAPVAPAPSSDLRHFLALSTLLTGYGSLDAATAAVYLRNVRADRALSAALDAVVARSGIASSNPPKTLAALTATGIFASPESLAVTATILAAWFSGLSAGAHGTSTETWDDALAWKACTFTKPPATCGGATGYWAKAPA